MVGIALFVSIKLAAPRSTASDPGAAGKFRGQPGVHHVHRRPRRRARLFTCSSIRANSWSTRWTCCSRAAGSRSSADSSLAPSPGSCMRVPGAFRSRPCSMRSRPTLMLGYAIGRIGCQIAGDGDWGIAADLEAKPFWLPTWLWAQTYDGNILGVVIPEPGVYPTPIYEVVMASAACALLWKLANSWPSAGLAFLRLSGAGRRGAASDRVDPRQYHVTTCSAWRSRRRSSSRRLPASRDRSGCGSLSRARPVPA